MSTVVLLGNQRVLQEIGDFLTGHNLSLIGLRIPELDNSHNTNTLYLDLQNFHDLTIELMEIQPDVIIHLSPVYHYILQAVIDLDLIELELELVNHLIESMRIINPHYIYLQPNEDDLHLQEEIRLPMLEILNVLKTIKNHSILLYNPKELGHPLLNKQFLENFSIQILHVISSHKYGLSNLRT